MNLCAIGLLSILASNLVFRVPFFVFAENGTLKWSKVGLFHFYALFILLRGKNGVCNFVVFICLYLIFSLWSDGIDYVITPSNLFSLFRDNHFLV